MRIIKFNIPTIRTSIPDELSSKDKLIQYLETNEAELKKIKWYRARMYHNFSISKGNKKHRRIDAPDARLKYFQRKIARSLNDIYRVRQPVHGFVPDRSVKSNAASHLKRRYVLNVDIKDYFPSITENRIVGLLESIGLDDDVANLVGIICCLHNRLPQGAPSSPILSNMICFRMDKVLMRYSKKNRFVYTRYADDITLSSHQPMSVAFDGQIPTAGRVPVDLISKELQAAFSANGFSLNEDKCHYADRHSRRMVTGVKINELLNVDRKFVRNIRATLYSIEKLGIDGSQQKYVTSHNGQGSLEAHIRGKLSWLRHIRGQSDPVFRGLAIRFNNCFEKNIEITPTTQEIRDRAVWIIETNTNDVSLMSQGTAFFLESGFLVTAAHNVAGVTEAQIYHPSKRSNTFQVTVLKKCDHRDLALVNVELPNNEYYELRMASTAPEVGAQTIALGYPGFGPGDSLNVRKGDVSSRTKKSAVELIEVSQDLAQGMSGGPLLDDNNCVIGIIHKGGPHEARNFAVSADELKSWLAE